MGLRNLGDGGLMGNQALFTGSSPTFTAQTLSGQGLTLATMNLNYTGSVLKSWSSYSWTNAMVVALGAVLSGNIKICTLPVKGIISNMYVVINTPSAGTTTMTVSVGRTAATYVDYITAQNAQAAASTVYGGSAAQRGTNLTGYDLPAWATATDVYAQFVSTVQNLNAQTSGAGTIYLETTILT
jgi:hypothetical protein